MTSKKYINEAYAISARVQSNTGPLLLLSPPLLWSLPTRFAVTPSGLTSSLLRPADSGAVRLPASPRTPDTFGGRSVLELPALTVRSQPSPRTRGGHALDSGAVEVLQKILP